MVPDTGLVIGSQAPPHYPGLVPDSQGRELGPAQRTGRAVSANRERLWAVGAERWYSSPPWRPINRPPGP